MRQAELGRLKEEQQRLRELELHLPSTNRTRLNRRFSRFWSICASASKLEYSTQ